MFSNLFQKPLKKIGFEDMQYIIKNRTTFLIINTLPLTEQGCLIKNTISYQMEERIINGLMENLEFKRKIVVYGRNSCDETAEAKCKQLGGLGFIDVHLYVGGMFEWMLLQDVYGMDEFPTTSKVLDLLKYRPQRTFEMGLLEY
jgi:hypothetical protein